MEVSLSILALSLFSHTVGGFHVDTEGVNYSFLQADEEWVAGARDALTLMRTHTYKHSNELMSAYTVHTLPF